VVDSANAENRFPARVVERRDAGGGLVWVGLLPTPRAAATYVTPGQYVDVRVDEATGFFALAGVEGAGRWDLLLRPSGGASEALLAMPLGGHALVSGALGPGFPLPEAEERTLAIVVTAGALGPALPVALQRVRAGVAKATTLLVGTHALVGVPARDRLDELAAQGVTVRLVLSETPEAPHLRGYVQDHLDSIAPEIVFAAGLPAMMDGVRAWGRSRGVDVRTNH
jgi:NAD(P)H-flavin reductase